MLQSMSQEGSVVRVTGEFELHRQVDYHIIVLLIFNSEGELVGVSESLMLTREVTQWLSVGVCQFLKPQVIAPIRGNPNKNSYVISLIHINIPITPCYAWICVFMWLRRRVKWNVPIGTNLYGTSMIEVVYDLHLSRVTGRKPVEL